MGTFWNNWARAHRNARGIAMGLVLWVAVAVLGIAKCRDDQDPFTHREDVYVRLVDLRPEEGGSGAAAQQRATLMLPDSTTIQMTFPGQAGKLQPEPKVGDRVPIWIEHHKSGKRVFLFDMQRWQTQGPE